MLNVSASIRKQKQIIDEYVALSRFKLNASKSELLLFNMSKEDLNIDNWLCKVSYSDLIKYLGIQKLTNLSLFSDFFWPQFSEESKLNSSI